MSGSEAGASERASTRSVHPIRWIMTVAVLGVAVHVLLPQVAELEQGLRALREGRWPFLTLALTGAGLSFVAGAWMVRSSVAAAPPWVRTVKVQVAASAAATMTPMGVGWVAVNESFLVKEGIKEGRARAATGVNMMLTVVSHVGLLVVTLPFLPALSLPAVTPPQRRVFVDLAAAAAVATGTIVWIPFLRRKAMSILTPILQAVPDVVGAPRRSLIMVLAAAGGNVALGLALYGAVAAFGPVPAPLGVLVAYLLAATVAAIAPTPGGLGAMETALVAALTRLAVPGGQAVAATLAFRLASFWLPLGVGGVFLYRSRRRGWT